MRKWWQSVQDANLVPHGATPLPRLYEAYGKGLLAQAEHDPALSARITAYERDILEIRDDRGRAFAGFRLYAVLTGVANGALQSIFTPTGRVIDDDGFHVPTIRIAACCKIAITKNMISPSG